MIEVLKSFLSGLYNMLPDSPFQTIFSNEMYHFDFLHWLNWFIPFDICFKITEIWVTSIAAYYLFVIIKKVVFDLIIGKLLA